MLKEFTVFIKYAVVGILGTVVDVGSLYLFVEFLRLPILVATAISFVLAVINNFILNKVWTFQNKSSNVRKQFIKFSIVAGIGLGLTLILMSLLVYGLRIPDLVLPFSQEQLIVKGYVIAKLITSVIVLMWNFLGNKYWTFQDKIRAVQHLESYPYDLSVIVPAYNEKNRIGATLEAIHLFFQDKGLTREIIVVDDGSTDGTSETVRSFMSQIPDLKLVEYSPNQGKGYAVKAGVAKGQGRYVLFTDADNSTPIQEFDKFYPLLQEHEVVIGSRYTKGSQIIVKQSKYRILLGRWGNFLIQAFLIDGVQDTQCGFKAFQHGAAQEIFARMKIKRWGFDMEALAIARLLGYSIKEVPVSWYNSPDSRVRPIKDAFRTLQELVLIKLNLWGGRYH